MFEKRISENAKNILGILKEIVPAGSYLAGGTALALWIDHRNSYDLDIYSPNEFDPEEVKLKFDTKISTFKLISSTWQTLHGISDDTELSLFFYPYKLLNEPSRFLDFNMASVEDIAAMKLEAIAGRGLKRDFYDIYKIIQNKGWSLKHLIELNNEKYGRENSFTPHILRSLVYFDDAERMPERALEVDKEWENVKGFFIKEVSAIDQTKLLSLSI